MELAQDVIIAGGGGIGRAVGLLLANYPEFRGKIYIGDRHESVAAGAADWIAEGRSHPVTVIPYILEETGTQSIANIAKPGGVLLDCLPGHQAPRMARAALESGLHYVNLTEYVKETAEIVELASDAETGFVLQTGLAPGFVNILARSLYERFVELYKVKKVERITMRVGGLTTHTREPHYYGFTWSTIGVATEYMNTSWVIRDYKKTSVKALSERETMIIDGVRYEADHTSGGAADLPDVFEGIARNLDYKTLRYPGHYSWVEGLIKKVGHAENPVRALETEMLKVVPSVEEDVIVIYAAVTGFDKSGRLRKLEKGYHIGPMQVGGQMLRAIQATTAAPMAECARLLLTGKWKGVVHPSQIDTALFLSGPFIDRIYGRRAHQNGVPLRV